LSNTTYHPNFKTIRWTNNLLRENLEGFLMPQTVAEVRQVGQSTRTQMKNQIFS